MITLSKIEIAKVRQGLQWATLQQGKRRWDAGGPLHPVQQGVGKKTLFRVRIVAVSPVVLGTLTDEDARLCGYAELDCLKAAWRRRYKRWMSKSQVWMVQFVYDGPPVTRKQATLFDSEEVSPK